jgi:inorganic phosphate transporter, PiT family
VTLDLFVLIIVVITALAFDFTNGFQDTGNATATSIASGALKPKIAVALSASLNLVGAFLSTAVAAAIAKGLVDPGLVSLELIFAGLVGGITWNLLTWLLGLPSSSSHALIGGIVGVMIAAVGGHGVIWRGLVSTVIVPAFMAPIIATLVAAIGSWLVYRAVRGVPEERTDAGFRYGQVGSASLVSLAHGTNDAQKTMGVIFLALISYGAASKSDAMPPFWVILSCAVAIALGTYLGGWRIIRTLGKGLVEIKSPQGIAAESSSAAIILLSSHFGYSLSTTHVATGSILGSGVGKPGAEAAPSRISPCILIGGVAGITVGFLLLVGASTAIWLQSRKAPIDHTNVNHEWEATRRRAPASVGEAQDPRSRLERPTFMTAWFNYIAVSKILVFGLLVGAALPALFAVGVRLGAEG